MTLPRPEQFAEFFEAVYGYPPFPWQKRVAARVCAGEWPRVVAVPTAAGKTGCLDVAVFALACRAPSATRRIFFVVDRRIVVDQAFKHAEDLAKALHDAVGGILKTVAESLREIGGGSHPLDFYALRGGMYRETAWVRSPLQPTIVASTVDQVGSRMLFRGYGVSPSMMPVHAGLVVNDSLILLDEAHCSRPFDQTAEAVKNYRTWTGEALDKAPFHFVSLTATPGEGVPPEKVERINDEDLANDELKKRFTKAKPAELVIATGKKADAALVGELKKQAEALAKAQACVGIIVNRVATAKALADALGEDAVLLTGRMRALDRDRLFEERLKPLLSNAKIDQLPPKFVVGTQCLEVGADFDFHALVTECASLDALRQRFGRLNRVGNRDVAPAAVVISAEDAKGTPEDPVYGPSLGETWAWLKSHAVDERFDFGINAVGAVLKNTDPETLKKLNAPLSDAPRLFPAHLDCWVQTDPMPTPDPDPAPFLHGPKTGPPDVQVVFRGDLGPDDKKWTSIVALAPPSSSEAVPVRMWAFKKWLDGRKVVDRSSDVEGEVETDEEPKPQIPNSALFWRGEKKSYVVTGAEKFRPGTYVVPLDANDLGDFGQFPYGLTDLAEEAFLRSKDKAMIRLGGSMLSADDEDFDVKLTDEVAAAVGGRFPDWTDKAKKFLTNPRKRTVAKHPVKGWVVTTKPRLDQFKPEFNDEEESSYAPQFVLLEEHSRGVADRARRYAEGCGLPPELYETAGLLHDFGKLDPRFQKKIKGFAAGDPWAKSGNFLERDFEVHQYPKGARHELLSTAIAATLTDDDLTLHLIATHHGHARPFATPVDENRAAGKFPLKLFGVSGEWPSAEQKIGTWNEVLPERFWRVVRRYGWWGGAFREAIFRLADQGQSQFEQEDRYKKPGTVADPQFAPVEAKPERHPLVLSGLDGANPLAFLAALGTLAVCDRLSKAKEPTEGSRGTLGLCWNSSSKPVVLLPQPMTETQFVEALSTALSRIPEEHPCGWAYSLLEGKKEDVVAGIRRRGGGTRIEDSEAMGWVTALLCESSPEAASQLQTVRKDYLLGNIVSLMSRTTSRHLERTLFASWDYADGLDNQSLHWEPTEDRRHAYQWHMPSGDPTRKKAGGMLGANRLGFEAWPLFPSFPDGERVNTRGFEGNRANNTFFTWPLWSMPLGFDAIASMLALEACQDQKAESADLLQYGVFKRFRVQRILVGKTPNFTTSAAVV